MMLWRRSHSITIVVDILRVYIDYVLMTNFHYLIWPHLDICCVYTLPIHLHICNLSTSNFAFSILFKSHIHCIYARWAWSKAELGLKLNLKFGPRWTFGPRWVFCGPGRAMTPPISFTDKVNWGLNCCLHLWPIYFIALVTYLDLLINKQPFTCFHRLFICTKQINNLEGLK